MLLMVTMAMVVLGGSVVLGGVRSIDGDDDGIGTVQRSRYAGARPSSAP